MLIEIETILEVRIKLALMENLSVRRNYYKDTMETLDQGKKYRTFITVFFKNKTKI